MTRSKATPVMWRFATTAAKSDAHPFHYDDARSLNMVRDVDGQERPFASSSVSTAYVKSDRVGEAED